MRLSAKWAFVVSAAFVSLNTLAADPYPSRPIRMIVPFVAGGGTDLLGRFIAPRLGEQLKQQVVVDNRGGAGSILGTQILAKATPDGYTVATVDTAFAINPALNDKLPYDAERDFTIVAIIATSPSLIVVHPSFKIRTVPELVAAARKEPGKLTFGSAGVGSSSHLTLEMFNVAAKINILHVPYKGAGAAIIDVLAGHTALTSVVPGAVTAHLQSGAMIPLVITGKKSPPYLPNVPTFATAGYPSVNPEAFRFIIAPAGLPAPVLARLTKALAAIMSVPEFQTRLADNGFDPEFLTGNEARAFVTREIAKWRQAGRDAGVKLN